MNLTDYRTKEPKLSQNISNGVGFHTTEITSKEECMNAEDYMKNSLEKQEKFFKRVTNTKGLQFNVIGVSRCGCHSVVRWLESLGHRVNFMDGDCFTIKPDKPDTNLGEVIVVLRNPIDHHRSFERKYGRCPTKTPQERIKGLLHLSPIFVYIENVPTSYHITGREGTTNPRYLDCP